MAARALKHGLIVFFKLWPDIKYDMVIDCGGELFRVQVKGSQTGVISPTSGQRAGIQIKKQVSKERMLTRDDCDAIIGINANNGDCYVFPIDYVTALGKKSIAFKNTEAFLERWDYIVGNHYLSTAQNRKGIEKSEVQNKLKAILPSGTLPPGTDELRKLFYENCPPH